MSLRCIRVNSCRKRRNNVPKPKKITECHSKINVMVIFVEIHRSVDYKFVPTDTQSTIWPYWTVYGRKSIAKKSAYEKFLPPYIWVLHLISITFLGVRSRRTYGVRFVRIEPFTEIPHNVQIYRRIIHKDLIVNDVKTKKDKHHPSTTLLTRFEPV